MIDELSKEACPGRSADGGWKMVFAFPTPPVCVYVFDLYLPLLVCLWLWAEKWYFLCSTRRLLLRWCLMFWRTKQSSEAVTDKENAWLHTTSISATFDPPTLGCQRNWSDVPACLIWFTRGVEGSGSFLFPLSTLFVHCFLLAAEEASQFAYLQGWDKFYFPTFPFQPCLGVVHTSSWCMKRYPSPVSRAWPKIRNVMGSGWTEGALFPANCIRKGFGVSPYRRHRLQLRRHWQRQSKGRNQALNYGWKGRAKFVWRCRTRPDLLLLFRGISKLIAYCI